MPIVYHQLHPANVGQPGYAVAKELARQTSAFYGAVALIGVGIGGASCRSALAIAPAAPAFPAANALVNYAPPPLPLNLPVPVYGPALPFGIAYGNSQLAAGGLVLGAVGGHAERAALTGAGGTPLYLIPDGGGNDAVLYVELAPCGNCQMWLNGGGGGVANPYNGVINGAGVVTLHVWWRWEYPGPGLPVGMGGVVPLGGTAEMNLWHTWEWIWPGQVMDINGPSW